MPYINYLGRKVETKEGETILNAFIRQGVDVRFSCKNATCKTCKAKVLEGKIPQNSQLGLDPELAENNIILPCIAIPESDMVLDLPSEEDLRRKVRQESIYEFREERDDEHPKPDLELWKALGEGSLLIEILTDFYNKVYQDDRLAPFFKNTTIDRAIGKQYNFLEQIMTGKLIYFGSNPRTAHHWMVIDEDLFNYREDLLEESMQKLGLSEIYRKRWREMDEYYKAMLLKTHPWPKIIGGIMVPISGFMIETAEIDMVCDECYEEIPAGYTYRYHKDDGKAFCEKCAVLEDQK